MATTTHAPAVTERQYQGRVHERSRQLMSAWMGELSRAETEGRATGALMISGNCVELLRACHVLPMFPEVTALQNAIRHKSLPLILKAEQAGYSSDNCAYVKADVGLFLDGGMGPGKPIPFPTIIVCNYVGCNVYVKWFEHLADLSGARLFMLDVPFARTDAPSAEDVRYVVTQLRELITLCEGVTGRKFDIDELREVLAHAARAEDGYARCKHLTKHRPAPFDSYFDSINMMGPINVLRRIETTNTLGRGWKRQAVGYEDREDPVDKTLGLLHELGWRARRWARRRRAGSCPPSATRSCSAGSSRRAGGWRTRPGRSRTCG